MKNLLPIELKEVCYLGSAKRNLKWRWGGGEIAECEGFLVEL